MTNLKPCPFCDKPTEIISLGIHGHMPVCTAAPRTCFTGPIFFQGTEEEQKEAAAKWLNTRAEPPVEGFEV